MSTSLPSKVRIDSDRLSSSRKRTKRTICSLRAFLTGIVFAACILLAFSASLVPQLDGSSPAILQATSSSSNANGGAKAVAPDDADNIRPVVCNELLNDPTISDPSKSYSTLPLFVAIHFSRVHLSYIFFLLGTL